MWVRGLKQIAQLDEQYHSGSHPMWVRGLKLSEDQGQETRLQVAPYVGAWIETKEDGLQAA